ncbi:MAG: hypothetical protein ABS23_07890 [SAR92 bacterium BACL16 MAG-120619-bin48]|nr:MAG: hypothetical protein ABS23_07890 [SAR92 bacterium BACL16 MAG-120619-bin48]
MKGRSQERCVGPIRPLNNEVIFVKPVTRGKRRKKKVKTSEYRQVSTNKKAQISAGFLVF